MAASYDKLGQHGKVTGRASRSTSPGEPVKAIFRREEILHEVVGNATATKAGLGASPTP